MELREPIQEKPKKSSQDSISEDKFKKMLAEEDPSALDTYNVGETAEESGQIEVKDVQEKHFEKAVENIILKAKKLLENDLGDILSEEEKKQAELITEQIIDTKRRSGITDMWMSEANRLMQEEGNADQLKESAANNLFKEIKKEILSKIGKNETNH